MNTKQKLETIVKSLSRYSSGDNAQPFFFKIHESDLTIQIYHDSHIAHHYLNPNNLASLLSFGIILEMMEELGQKNNIIFDVKLAISDKNYSENGRVHWGSFVFTSLPDAIKDGDMFLKVRTNRLPYKADQVSLPNIDDDIKLGGNFSDSELDLILKCDGILWTNSTLLNHIFQWIHVTKASYQKHRSGFHYTEVGLDPAAALSVPFFKSKNLVKLMMAFPPVKIMAAKKSKEILKTTPSIYGIYAHVETPMDLINVGKRSYRIRLALAQKGIATQPLSLATFPFIFKKFNCNIGHTPDFYEKVQKAFKDKFHYDMNGKDITWMFRAGYPKTELPLSLRKDTSEIIIGD